MRGVLDLSASELKVSAKHRALQQWGQVLLQVHGKLIRRVSDSTMGQDFDPYA